jgi:hypothetical protein
LSGTEAADAPGASEGPRGLFRGALTSERVGEKDYSRLL